MNTFYLISMWMIGFFLAAVSFGVMMRIISSRYPEAIEDVSPVRGTPKNLSELCENILDDSKFKNYPEETMRHHFRDYLAQAVGASRLKALDEGEDKQLVELFNKLTGEKIS
jgi:hypothetical protein